MIDVLNGHSCWISQIALSFDGRQMASVSGVEIFIWDLETGEIVATLKNPEGPFSVFGSIAYSEDGNRLATGFGIKDVGSVRIWNIKRHCETLCLTDEDWAALSLDFAKKDNRIVADFLRGSRAPPMGFGRGGTH